MWAQFVEPNCHHMWAQFVVPNCHHMWVQFVVLNCHHMWAQFVVPNCHHMWAQFVVPCVVKRNSLGDFCVLPHWSDRARVGTRAKIWVDRGGGGGGEWDRECTSLVWHFVAASKGILLGSPGVGFHSTT